MNYIVYLRGILSTPGDVNDGGNYTIDEKGHPTFYEIINVGSRVDVFHVLNGKILKRITYWAIWTMGGDPLKYGRIKEENFIYGSFA